MEIFLEHGQNGLSIDASRGFAAMRLACFEKILFEPVDP